MNPKSRCRYQNCSPPASITYLANIFQHKEGTWAHARPWTVLWNGNWSRVLFLSGIVKETITRNHSLHSFYRSSRYFSRTVFVKVWSRPRNLSEMQVLRSGPRPFQLEILGMGVGDGGTEIYWKAFWMILIHTRVWKLLLQRRLGWNRMEVIVQKK